MFYDISYASQRTALPTERTIASNVILQSWSRLQHNPIVSHHRRLTMELNVTYTPAIVAYPCHQYLIDVYYDLSRVRQMHDLSWCDTCFPYVVVCAATEKMGWLWEYSWITQPLHNEGNIGTVNVNSDL